MPSNVVVISFSQISHMQLWGAPLLLQIYKLMSNPLRDNMLQTKCMHMLLGSMFKHWIKKKMQDNILLETCMFIT